MSLPKFTYVPPVLNASKAIVLNSILIKELNTNYKSLHFYEYFKSLMVYIPLAIGILCGLVFYFSQYSLFGFMSSVTFGIIALLAFVIGLFMAPEEVFDKLKLDTIPARNEAVKIWVESRYGVEVSIEDISNLIAEHRADKDGLIRVNDSLVRFQTVVGEGQLLIDSAGLELKVLVPVS